MASWKEDWGKTTWSMRFSFLGALAAAGAIALWCIVRFDANNLLWLEALTAALVGYGAAMLATPYSKTEKKQFSDFAKLVSGIFTGFLLSKLSPLIDAFVAVPAGGGRAPITTAGACEQVLVMLSSFLLALLFVLGGRLYWSWGK